MVKRKITEFTLSHMGESTPCGIPLRLSELCSGAATLVFDAHIERADMASVHVYLRLPYIGAPFTLSVNGSTVAALTGGAESYVFDIKGYLTEGQSRIELFFKNGVGKAALYRAPEIIRTNYAVIKSISLTQRHQNGGVTLGINLDTVGSTDNVRAVATLVSGAGQLYYGGITRGSGSITVKDPLLWWPSGMGMQNMYKLTVNLYGDMEIEDTVECKVGLRSLQTAESEGVTSIRVNGMDFLPMGAIYRPDPEISAVNKERALSAEINAAAGSGFNALVLPADSAPPSGRLAELCDLYGILLIKELSELDREGARGYAALSTHPSVGIFDLSGDGSIDELITEANSDFCCCAVDAERSIPAARSLPCDRALNATLPEGSHNLFDEAVEGDCEEEIHTALIETAKRYPYAGTLSDFAYASRLTQADSVGEELRRLRMSGESGRRAVFSGLGCEGRLLSDSCIDGLGGLKALAYTARRVFSPLAAQALYEGGKVTFKVANGSRKVFDGELEYRIADNKNNTLRTGRLAVVADPGDVAMTEGVDIGAEVLGREGERYLEYTLFDGTTPVYRDTLLLVKPKRFAFLDPGIRTLVSGSDKRFTLAISASAFAKGVEISVGDVPVLLSDNYFDITTSAPVKITLNTGSLETVERIRTMLKVRSVYDIKKRINDN